MELKLVDSKPLSNEIIDSFYQRLEQQQLDAERQEELEYNESGIITRRKFLQYSALGAVGLGLGLSTEEAEANPMIIIPTLLSIFQAILRANEPAEGRITIINNTNINKTGNMKLKLLCSRDLKSKRNTKAFYSIPKFTEQTFEFENGPSGVARRDTKVCVQASNRNGRARQRGIILRA